MDKAHYNRMRIAALRVLLAQAFPRVRVGALQERDGIGTATVELPKKMLLSVSNAAGVAEPLFGVARLAGGPRARMRFEAALPGGLRGRDRLSAREVEEIIARYLRSEDGSSLDYRMRRMAKRTASL